LPSSFDYVIFFKIKAPVFQPIFPGKVFVPVLKKLSPRLSHFMRVFRLNQAEIKGETYGFVKIKGLK